MIDDQRIHVQAQVHTMSGYSAHADKSDLIRFVEGISAPPKEIHLIHSEKAAKEELFVSLNSNNLKVIR